ncbi:hypothetical protein DER46DRAFT_580597 [Fusarium sp. MPI-SDFR-AT-0072]|nr:hypothetical protein DER46DRAFT_580597 [Fusarium sp. MPI-SDFR-AT-0072]
MTSTHQLNLLQEVNKKINIDIDSLDTEFLNTLSITPNDQTSNPRWLALQLQSPSSAELIKTCLNELHDQEFLAICTRLAVGLCRRNVDLIRGRVLVQASPSVAYDCQRTLDHARLYVSEFARAGIPKDRYCIKIMATGPGLNAARILKDEGIATLGTGVFSVAQAVACSQAGCLFISPYYNEIRTFIDTSLWPNVADPALDHPFSNRIAQMVEAYQVLFQQTGQPQPLIKNAGFQSYQEVIASAELGCHSATVSLDLLEEMQKMKAGSLDLPETKNVAKLQHPYSKEADILPSRLRPLLSSDACAQLEPGEKRLRTELHVDYLANDGKLLKETLEKDKEATRMVDDALGVFVYCENEIRKAVSPQASL